MKKMISLLLTGIMVASLAGCGNKAANTDAAEETSAVTERAAGTEAADGAEEGMDAAEENTDTPETVTITGLNGASEKIEVTVPYDPQRIVVADMASLDILDNLGLGERVVGSPTTALDYLQDYVNNDNIENLGTIKEVDMEKVMACEPDVIFMGGRMAEYYDALSEIAPVVRLISDTEVGLVESVRNNAAAIASIFGLEEEVDEKMAGFESRIEALREIADGKTAVVGMCTSGSFNVLGNDGRCSIIGVECGFENIGVSVASAGGSERGGKGHGSGKETGNETEQGAETEQSSGSGQTATATHGNEASFEYIVSLNPDYVFVMDRDAAIGTDGAKLAPEIMENELVMGTDAYKNGNIVYLEHPGVWYTAEGGITALDTMIADLESELLP